MEIYKNGFVAFKRNSCHSDKQLQTLFLHLSWRTRFRYLKLPFVLSINGKFLLKSLFHYFRNHFLHKYFQISFLKELWPQKTYSFLRQCTQPLCCGSVRKFLRKKFKQPVNFKVMIYDAHVASTTGHYTLPVFWQYLFVVTKFTEINSWNPKFSFPMRNLWKYFWTLCSMRLLPFCQLIGWTQKRFSENIIERYFHHSRFQEMSFQKWVSLWQKVFWHGNNVILMEHDESMFT